MQKKSNMTIGLDLGGTKMYGILLDENNQILARCKQNTDFGAGPEKISSDLIALAKETAETGGVQFDSIERIGVAVPASVDPETADCLHAPNLGLKNFSMKGCLEKISGKKVFLGNDGNLGLLAEYSCGAAKGFNNVVGYFVGTGLGGGVIINGKPYYGNGGLAGEFGHAIVKQGGRRCGCGHRGCAEAYCSKIAFVKRLHKMVWSRGMKTELPKDKFNEKSRNIKSKYLAKAYNAGDSAVCEVVNQGAFMLGVAAAAVTAIVSPECIVLGGGVISALGKEMLPGFKKSFENHLFALSPDKVAIRLSELGDDCVAVGAALLARAGGKF